MIEPFQHIGERPCGCIALDIRRGDWALLVLRPCRQHSYRGIGWHIARASAESAELRPLKRGHESVIDDMIRLMEYGQKFRVLRELLK